MNEPAPIEATGAVARLIRFCLTNKLIVLLLAFMLLAWGVLVAPFDWNLGGTPRSPVPVGAIPDIGENQQIIFTEWMGRSPQDVEDQITFPLTAALLGIPEVKTIRSYSYFGFSSVYVIFKESAEWDWSRAKILEKLNSLPAGTLPEEVSPALGPDATALGQVFWYTLEGPSTKPENPPVDGILTNCGASRTFMCATLCNRPTAWPKSPRWGDFSKNTRSMSTPTPCAPSA